MEIRNKEQFPRGITVPGLVGNGGTICELLGEDFEDLSLEHKFEVLKLEMKLIEAKQRDEDGDCRDEQTFFRTEALWAIADALNANKDGIIAVSDALDPRER